MMQHAKPTEGQVHANIPLSECGIHSPIGLQLETAITRGPAQQAAGCVTAACPSTADAMSSGRCRLCLQPSKLLARLWATVLPCFHLVLLPARLSIQEAGTASLQVPSRCRCGRCRWAPLGRGHKQRGLLRPSAPAPQAPHQQQPGGQQADAHWHGDSHNELGCIRACRT